MSVAAIMIAPINNDTGCAGGAVGAGAGGGQTRPLRSACRSCR